MRRWKMWLSNWCLRHVFKAVTEEDYFEIKYIDKDKKIGYVVKSGQRIPESEQLHLSSEASAILKMPTFQKVLEDFRWQTTWMMVNKTKVLDDLYFHKATLYTLDNLVSKLNHLAELELPKSKERK